MISNTQNIILFCQVQCTVFDKKIIVRFTFTSYVYKSGLFRINLKKASKNFMRKMENAGNQHLPSPPYFLPFLENNVNFSVLFVLWSADASNFV